jgi:hypothetical protein
LAEHPHALPVLAKGRAAVAVPGKETDQLALGWLLEGLQLDPALGVEEGLLLSSTPHVGIDEASQGGAELAP